jgi:phosphotransferase system IIA component
MVSRIFLLHCNLDTIILDNYLFKINMKKNLDIKKSKENFFRFQGQGQRWQRENLLFVIFWGTAK